MTGVDLDDPAALEGADPVGILRTALGLAEQVRRGRAAGLGVPGLPSGDRLNSVTLVGMGGSGVSGDLVRALYRDRLTMPVDVVRGPALPGHCDKDTIVVCTSYSGDTAETLLAFEEAAARGCRTVAVTAGGRLAERAHDLRVPVVPVPAENPMPRTAMGFLLLCTLGALEAIGVVPALGEDVEEAGDVLDRLADELGPGRPTARNEAKLLAGLLHARTPVVWGGEGVGAAAAVRWKTELNENAKVPAWAAAMPELGHNEVVGWTDGTGEPYAVVALRHEDEHDEVARRFGISLEVAADAGARTEEVWATGDTGLSRLLSLCMKGSVTSVYLAGLRGVDPAPIASIDRIKAALAEEGEEPS